MNTRATMREALERARDFIELTRMRGHLQAEDGECVEECRACAETALLNRINAALTRDSADPRDEDVESEKAHRELMAGALDAQPKTEKLTCEDCAHVDCDYRDDPYNTNGDCLASK